MDELLLAPGLLDEMINHAAACYPEEACGLLGGCDSRAMRFYPVENIRHSPTAYEMAPSQQIRAMFDIEEAGLALIAIFHSHPSGPARPSAADIAHAGYPDVAWIIVSLIDQERPDARAFTIRGGQSQMIRLSTAA